MKFTNSLGLVDETPCPGCGWPQCDCLCVADDLIDWQARAKAAEAYIERIRQALGGYPDSDLASLSFSLRTRCDALEAIEADSLSVREALATTIDERDEARAEAERLRAQVATIEQALAKALDWFENAPVSYANGNTHNGLDEGSVIGGQMHDELTEQIRCALHGLVLPED